MFNLSISLLIKQLPTNLFIVYSYIPNDVNYFYYFTIHRSSIKRKSAD